MVTLPVILLLIIMGVALVLFSFEWIPADVVALGVLVVLMLTGLLPPEQAFAGFGNEAVLLILGLLIMTAALINTGVVDILGRNILRRTGGDVQHVLSLVMIAPGVLSAFISNTASTAFFLPVVIGIGRRSRVSLSKLLMPLAFSAILASSVTLVATSTNILVSGLLIQNKMPPIGMFELTPVGILILILGIGYMFVIGRRLIPERKVAEDGDTILGNHLYLTETVIKPGSPLIGKNLRDAGLGRDLDLTVLRLQRGNQRYLAPEADLELEQDDVLLLEGARDEILKIKNTTGIEFQADADMRVDERILQSDSVGLVEIILLPRSPLIGRTLKGLQFRERFGLQVLAINRYGETIHHKISQTMLRMGDILLVQGDRGRIAALEEDRLFRVLGTVDTRHPDLKRAPIAMAAFAGSLLLGSINLVALPVAVLLGVLVVFLTRCITPEEAYREVDWRILILIGSMLGMGQALALTGTASFLAMKIVDLFGHANPAWLLTGFFVLTVVLTQPMSNQAAAVVVVPIALQTAQQLGLNPRTFAIMIAVAASTSFMTPLEPACLMVYGPGRYKFVDFLKVGSLLTLLIYLIAILLVPLIWPL